MLIIGGLLNGPPILRIGSLSLCLFLFPLPVPQFQRCGIRHLQQLLQSVLLILIRIGIPIVIGMGSHSTAMTRNRLTIRTVAVARAVAAARAVVSVLLSLLPSFYVLC